MTATPESLAATAPDATTQLLTVLKANVLVTALSILTLLGAAGPIADASGITTTPVRLVGLSLVPFGAFVAWAASASPQALPMLARLIGWADAVWVVATAAVVALGLLDAGGIALAVASGTVVAGFAVLELRGAAALEA